MKPTAALLLILALLPARARAAWIDPLPGRADRSEDFSAAFSRGVYERESGLADGASAGFQTSARWLFDSQARLVSRAAEQALRAQYALDEWSSAWLSRPWDVEKASLAAAIGAAFLYTDGLHFHEQAAGFSIRGRLAAARQLRGDQLATVEVGRVGSPLSLSAAWGRRVPAFGARYALRY